MADDMNKENDMSTPPETFAPDEPIGSPGADRDTVDGASGAVSTSRTVRSCQVLAVRRVVAVRRRAPPLLRARRARRT